MVCKLFPRAFTRNAAAVPPPGRWASGTWKWPSWSRIVKGTSRKETHHLSANLGSFEVPIYLYMRRSRRQLSTHTMYAIPISRVFIPGAAMTIHGKFWNAIKQATCECSVPLGLQFQGAGKGAKAAHASQLCSMMLLTV